MIMNEICNKMKGESKEEKELLNEYFEFSDKYISIDTYQETFCFAVRLQVTCACKMESRVDKVVNFLRDLLNRVDLKCEPEIKQYQTIKSIISEIAFSSIKLSKSYPKLLHVFYHTLSNFLLAKLVQFDHSDFSKLIINTICNLVQLSHLFQNDSQKDLLIENVKEVQVDTFQFLKNLFSTLISQLFNSHNKYFKLKQENSKDMQLESKTFSYILLLFSRITTSQVVSSFPILIKNNIDALTSKLKSPLDAVTDPLIIDEISNIITIPHIEFSVYSSTIEIFINLYRSILNDNSSPYIFNIISQALLLLSKNLKNINNSLNFRSDLLVRVLKLFQLLASDILKKPLQSTTTTIGTVGVS